MGSLLLLVGIFWFAYLRPTFKVATGYTAKYVCSSTFLSNISADNIKAALDILLVRDISYSIDSVEKQVTASLFGLAKQKATYYETENSCGCLLGTPNFPIRKARQLLPSKENAELLWPEGDKLHDTIPENVDVKRLNDIAKNTLEASPATLAITVAYKDLLVGEYYNKGVDKSTRLLGWSMTKSIGNALMGILEKSNKLDIHRTPEIEEWQGDERRDITIDQLLKMSSGLEWTENYSALSDVTKMLYLKDDFPGFAVRSKAKVKPSQEWLYSSGTTNILCEILRSEFDSYDQFLAFPYEALLHQIGMHSVTIELDNAGNHVLSSYAWATARDWTRFGLLYLYKGDWFGKEIFTEDWVAYSTTPAPESNGLYGAQLWLNSSGKRLPNVPRDAFYENGFGGQRILIVPSKEMVITILSGNQPGFDFDTFYVDVFSCFAD